MKMLVYALNGFYRKGEEGQALSVLKSIMALAICKTRNIIIPMSFRILRNFVILLITKSFTVKFPKGLTLLECLLYRKSPCYRFFKSLFIIVVCTVSAKAITLPKYLGTFGQLYEIKEPDLMAIIERKAKIHYRRF